VYGVHAFHRESNMTPRHWVPGSRRLETK